jgi:phosphatidylserine/phosphatidylglycerophosphate/cardiolipin synthase-like enzyme
MEALFTSLDGGDALRRRILELIDEASALAVSHRIDLHVMTFAFTDQGIGNALADAAIQRPLLRIRILADWSQRIRARGQQVGRLAALNLPNLQVRYSNDQPYVWDATVGHMRWSYHASHGLLHHKTLGVLVEGRPWRLICGSFNWTAAAARNYENLLILTNDQPGSHQIMTRVELEFEALWSDGRFSLSPYEAHLHYQAILKEYGGNPSLSPTAIGGFVEGVGDNLQALDPERYPDRAGESLLFDETSSSADPKMTIAFSCRGPERGSGRRGCAARNRQQHLLIRAPSGKIRSVPLTITNLAIETISRAAPGDTLKVAMYGMSARVPEYGALLAAARRGVRVFLLLDRLAAAHVASRLLAAGPRGSPPIEVRRAGRMMHQKYIIHAETATVVTGTANMSTDSSSRHFEHRIRIGGCGKLAEQFCADFDKIWTRLLGDRCQLPAVANENGKLSKGARAADFVQGGLTALEKKRQRGDKPPSVNSGDSQKEPRANNTIR